MWGTGEDSGKSGMDDVEILRSKILELEVRLMQLLELAREIRGTSSPNSTSASLLSLSLREQEVARYLAEGHTSAQVARALHISVHTVRSHKRRIYEKLGVHSQPALIARMQVLTK